MRGTNSAVAAALLVVMSRIGPALCQYGDQTNGYPSWRERSLLVLTNACRMDPPAYRDAYVGSYSILLPANYPATFPLYWNYNLNRSARAHAEDMASDCGLDHSSCDGTAWNTRIRSYYTETQTLGENIATGEATPQATVRQWLLDERTGGVVPADKTTCGTGRCDGHRYNIMDPTYREMGTGYAHGTVAWYHFWVQDLAAGAPDYSNRIAAGSHLFLVNGRTTFMANYYHSGGGAPTQSTVVIDGVEQNLTLSLGTAVRGTYTLEVARGTACRSYYFRFVDSQGTTWRYPENGALRTFDEGSCAEEYTSSSIRAPRIGRTAGGLSWSGRVAGENRVRVPAEIARSCTASRMHDLRGRTLGVCVWAVDRAVVWELRPAPAAGVYAISHRLVDGRVVAGVVRSGAGR